VLVVGLQSRISLAITEGVQTHRICGPSASAQAAGAQAATALLEGGFACGRRAWTAAGSRRSQRTIWSGERASGHQGFSRGPRRRR
jgi:hypothetical protein